MNCQLGCEHTGSDNASDKRQNCRLLCRVKLSFRKINGNRRKCTHRTRATSDKIFQATKFGIFIISCVRCCDKRQFCRLLCRVKLSFRKINGNRRKCTHRTRATSDKIFQATKFFKRQATKFGIFMISCVRCCDKRQFCRLLCRVKLSFCKINGNRRKCTHRTRATSDKIFQATSDKIWNFYDFMRALLRQATILSLALSLPVRSHP